MTHEIIIAGRKVVIEWNLETSRRFDFRMGSVGGEPTGRELGNTRTVTTAFFKVLWGLLPPADLAIYPTPEELYIATDHETEGKAIFEAVSAIYQERFPTKEKKSISTKSPSLESNSD